MAQIPKIQSVHAILILNGNYILQLRDRTPELAAAGQWSLFGGKVRPGETPLETIRREIYEELSIEPLEFSYLWFEDWYFDFEKNIIRTWFFVSDVSRVWSGHVLREGRAAAAFRFKQFAVLDIPEVMRRALERFYRQRKKFIGIV